MSKTIVLTGGAGFIGSHVADRLLKAGHRLHIIDDLSFGREANVPAGAVLHRMDIRSAEAAEAVRSLRPDALIHLAAQIDVRRSLREAAHDADINIVGGLNVLQAARDAGTGQVVFASSAATYGTPPVFPTPEDRMGEPVSPYGLSKHTFERYLGLFRDLYGMKTACLRFSNVYGPRQTVKGEAGAVAIFIRKILRKEPIVINGDGGQTRDYVFVTDVAEMVARAAEMGLDGAFNVSTGRETSVNDLAALVLQAAGSTTAVEHVPAVPKEDRRSCLDPRKSKEAAGWEATVALPDGVRATWEHASQDPDFAA